MATENKTNEQRIFDALSRAVGQFNYAIQEVNDARKLCKELPEGEKYVEHLGKVWEMMISITNRNADVLEDAISAAAASKKQS